MSLFRFRRRRRDFFDVRGDFLALKVVCHLLWHLFQYFLCQLSHVSFELVEWNKLHHVSLLVRTRLLGKQRISISIQSLHHLKLCIANSNDYDTQRQIRPFN